MSLGEHFLYFHLLYSHQTFTEGPDYSRHCADSWGRTAGLAPGLIQSAMCRSQVFHPKHTEKQLQAGKCCQNSVGNGGNICVCGASGLEPLRHCCWELKITDDKIPKVLGRRKLGPQNCSSYISERREDTVACLVTF